MMKREPGYSAKYASSFIRLTQDVVALVDPDTLSKFGRLNWCAFNHGNRWVAVRGSNPKIYMHREIMNVRGDAKVDHKKHYSIEVRVIDNRRSNLRIATTSQNAHNQRHHKRETSSKYKGVCWSKNRGKWISQIRLNNKNIYLGYFTDEMEAAYAYDRAAIKLHGEFALTNQHAGLLK